MTDTITNFKTHNFDIKIKEVEKVLPHKHVSSWLTLMFSGNDINVKIINALRRASMVNVPTYAFPVGQMTIEANTCTAFNNDMMKLRLGYLPIYGLDCGVPFLSEKYWKNVNYADTQRQKHPREKLVELYVNSHNNSANIVNVTTNDVTMYVDGEEIKPYDPTTPILIVKLRPNDTFKCHLRGAIGVGHVDARWRASKLSYYDILDNDPENVSYRFTIEGNRQTDEYIILIRTCDYLIKELGIIKTEIQSRIHSNQIAKKNKIKIKLDGEDHTMGEIINYELQSHDKIIFSGCSKPDHLIKAIMLTIEGVTFPAEIMLECIDILINKFSHIGAMLVKMNEKVEPSAEKIPKKKTTKRQTK
jgi:DNA-directed RNA polymerase subunit L